MTGKELFRELGKEKYDTKHAAVKVRLPSGETFDVSGVELTDDNEIHLSVEQPQPEPTDAAA